MAKPIEKGQTSKSISPLPSWKSWGHGWSWMVSLQNSRQVPTKMKQCCFFLNSVSIGVFSHVVVKVLRQTDMFVFWRSLGQIIFASQKRLGSVPQNFLPLVLWGKWLLLQKRCCGWLPELFLTSTFVSQSPSGVRVMWIVDMSHLYTSTLQKMINLVVRCCGVLSAYCLFPCPNFWNRPVAVIALPSSSGKWWDLNGEYRSLPPPSRLLSRTWSACCQKKRKRCGLDSMKLNDDLNNSSKFDLNKNRIRLFCS